MNKKLKNIISRTLIIGGLATTAGSLYDYSQNKTMHEEKKQEQKIRDELREKHAIKVECSSVPSGGFPSAVCIDTVTSAKNEEEEETIIAEFYDELDQKLSNMPKDPEAHSRGARDGLGTFSGLIITAAGFGLRNKEY